MDVITLIGVCGAALVLVGFVGNRLLYWQADAFLYLALNTVGSLVLIGYSVIIDSYPFIVLNLIWFLFSVNDVFQRKI